MKTFAQISFLTLALVAGTAANAMQDAAATAPAIAATTAGVRPGAMLKTADGVRLGRIDRVLNGADGKAERVSVIYKSRLVYLPVSTLSAANDGYVTNLTKADVRKLK